MSDFVSLPLDKQMNENNPISRIEAVEAATGAKPSATVVALGEVSANMGDIVSGRFLTPDPATATSQEPTNTGFTGSFMSALGETFNSVVYNIGSVAAGVLQWGANTAGQLIAGAGAVTLDKDGIAIEESASYVAPSAIKFLVSSVLHSSFFGFYTAGAHTLIAQAEAVSGKTSTADFRAQSPSGKLATVFLQANCDVSSTSIWLRNDGSTNKSIIFNSAAESVDVVTSGGADANLIYADASTDRVGIGTATPGYKLDVNGDVNTASGSHLKENGANVGMFLIADSGILSASAANVDFQDIPATYKHLRLVCSLRSDRAANSDQIWIRFNNDSGNNYDYLHYQIYQSATLATVEGLAQAQTNSGFCAGDTGVASDFSNCVIDINDYANTNINKDMRASGTFRAATTTTNIRATGSAGHWRSTAAINRITILPAVGTNWKQYSRITLYGYN